MTTAAVATVAMVNKKPQVGKQQPSTIPPRLALAMQGQMQGQAMQGKVRTGRGVMPRLLQALAGGR